MKLNRGPDALANNWNGFKGNGNGLICNEIRL